jgi:hypothetical protein
MSHTLYECPRCKYMDSDKDMAESHCVDSETSLW